MVDDGGNYSAAEAAVDLAANSDEDYQSVLVYRFITLCYFVLPIVDICPVIVASALSLQRGYSIGDQTQSVNCSFQSISNQ